MPPGPDSEPYEQYKLMTEDTARISDRRHNTNTLYLSANSILLGASALLIQQSGLKTFVLLFLVLLIDLAGCALCVGWLAMIFRYRRVIRWRFIWLQEIEQSGKFHWPIDMYTQQNKHEGEGIDRRFSGMSGIEANIPIIFLVTYALVAIIALAAKFQDIIAQLFTWGVLPH